MSNTIITAETVQVNLQQAVADSRLGIHALAALSGIALGDLRTKLAAEQCHFTMSELMRLMLTISVRSEVLFKPVEVVRELHRHTEPGQPAFEEGI